MGSSKEKKASPVNYRKTKKSPFHPNQPVSIRCADYNGKSYPMTKTANLYPKVPWESTYSPATRETVRSFPGIKKRSKEKAQMPNKEKNQITQLSKNHVPQPTTKPNLTVPQGDKTSLVPITALVGSVGPRIEDQIGLVSNQKKRSWKMQWYRIRERARSKATENRENRVVSSKIQMPSRHVWTSLPLR